MPAGKWGVEVREEIGGKHYVTPGPGPGFIRGVRRPPELGGREGPLTAFLRAGL